MSFQYRSGGRSYTAAGDRAASQGSAAAGVDVGLGARRGNGRACADRVAELTGEVQNQDLLKALSAADPS